MNERELFEALAEKHPEWVEKICAEAKRKIIYELLKRLDTLQFYYESDYYSDDEDALWSCIEVIDILKELIGESNENYRRNDCSNEGLCRRKDN